MTPGQMLRTSAYWWITASVALATPAVLLFSPRILELAGRAACRRPPRPGWWRWARRGPPQGG